MQNLNNLRNIVQLNLRRNHKFISVLLQNSDLVSLSNQIYERLLLESHQRFAFFKIVLWICSPIQKHNSIIAQNKWRIPFSTHNNHL